MCTIDSGVVHDAMAPGIHSTYRVSVLPSCPNQSFAIHYYYQGRFIVAVQGFIMFFWKFPWMRKMEQGYWYLHGHNR
ncbi:hypothetical protein BDW42DRAFT_171940 [Aspergillus taichungensis]|uniref:Uncharacterized protein n=1 Tax=Aspergillus taichungensis TaxID=482145 RepID=A0A2J5HRB1_9EURO|nr:hypothetical protein BDW42DRAFT_171940 [Aspergillus taichungensis]